jgi:rod shape determining protein RodA
MTVRQFLRSLDWLALGAAGLLLLLSLAMLFSSTYSTQGLFGGRLYRQLVAIGVGLGGYILLARTPYHVFRRYAWVVYSLTVSGLVLVALSARVIRGAASRLTIAGFQIQPSEFIKIALVIALAAVFARVARLNLKAFIWSLIIVGIPVGLIILEPDIGVSGLIIIFWLLMVVFMGLPWPVVAGIVVVGAMGGIAAWQWVLVDYQKDRILVFLDPTRDPLGGGYNIVQSIIALGSGRMLGRGLGHGPQSQLNFLPEQHTDFILASIGEELGFVGILVVIGLYALLMWRILQTARATRDPFGQLLCVGVFVVLLISFIVSAGMNMGLLPVTGIPLPLVSYGGSNIIATLLLLGIVQSVRLHSWFFKPTPLELTHLT